MTPSVAIGAVVFDVEGRVLVVKRAHPPMQGAWTILGGKPGPGEALEAVVKREVEEETGLAVDVVGLIEIVALAREGYRYDVHEYLCTVHASSPAPVAADDALDVRFVDVAALVALDVDADARAVIGRGAQMLAKLRSAMAY